jgi:monoamine oxidase
VPLYDRVYDRALKPAASSLLVLIVALISVSAFAVEEGADSTVVDHDVVIIGAGSAGQYAAYELNYLGFDVKVLEARPRRHGMLHPPQTVGTNPTLVTTIAEGITGDEEVNWHYYDVMALDENRFVPILDEPSGNGGLYMIDGHTVLGDDVTKGLEPELYDYWDFYYDWAGGYTGDDIDMETYLCDVLGVCRDAHVAFNYYKGNYPGGEFMTRLENIGARSLAEQEKLWDLGFGEWASASADPAESWTGTLDELYFNQIVDKVQLNHTVTDIDTSGAVAAVTAVDAKCSNCHAQPGPDRGVPIPDNGNHPRVTVTANAVLSTVPIGVLKAGDITFAPALPQSKLDALDLIGVGNGGKLFMQFSSRFWDENIDVFYPDGLVTQYCWDYEYRGGDGGAVLTCYQTGELGEDLDAVGDLNAQIAAVLSDLDAMFSGTPFSDAYVSGSGFWKNMDNMLHSKGGFSYPKIGSYPTDDESPSAREVLAEPVGTKLYFAGEATHNAWAATVVGAMDSGLRAAGEIDADHEPVPEPGGSAMLLAGAAFLGLLYRRRVRGLRLG